MKSDNIIKYGVYSLSLSTILTYIMRSICMMNTSFIVHHFLLPAIITSIALFLYALNYLHNSIKEKSLAILLIIFIPHLTYYVSYHFLTPEKDIARYNKIYTDAYKKEIRDKYLELNAREGYKQGQPASEERKKLVEKDIKFMYQWYQIENNTYPQTISDTESYTFPQKTEEELLAIRKKAFIFNLIKIMLLGIVSISTLYLSTIYTLTSIIGISLVYTGTIVLGLKYAGSLGLYFSHIFYKFDLFWLIYLFLLIALAIQLKAIYQNCINRTSKKNKRS